MANQKCGDQGIAAQTRPEGRGNDTGPGTSGPRDNQARTGRGAKGTGAFVSANDTGFAVREGEGYSTLALCVVLTAFAFFNVPPVNPAQSEVNRVSIGSALKQYVDVVGHGALKKEAARLGHVKDSLLKNYASK